MARVPKGSCAASQIMALLFLLLHTVGSPNGAFFSESKDGQCSLCEFVLDTKPPRKAFKCLQGCRKRLEVNRTVFMKSVFLQLAFGEASLVSSETLDTRRQLLVRPRHREARRTHLSSKDPEQRKVYSDWDGQATWEWDNPRTLYFEPVAGLGNRLRALASAVVVAREAGVGLKVIWREEVECGDWCGSMPPFNSSWPDLFSYPKLRLVPNFPGSNFSVHEENVWLRPNLSATVPDAPPIVPGFNCTVHNVQSYGHFKDLLANEWTHVHGEEVLCVKGELWTTKNGEGDGKFFYRLLQPSPPVKKMLDEYKLSVAWDERHIIGVHIRRTDLAITQPDGTKKKMENLVSLAKYIDKMRKLTSLAEGIKGIAYFIATDDAEAEKMMRTSFEEGMVYTFPKTAWSRSTVEGIQQALVDVLLLSECPVLIGTYYSSYSETAKLIGWPYYIQIGNDLAAISLETTFEDDTASQ